MHTYVICVVLYVGAQRTCWELRPDQTCEQVTSEWTERARAWGRRSKLPPKVLAHCACRDDMGKIRRDEYVSVTNY